MKRKDKDLSSDSAWMEKLRRLQPRVEQLQRLEFLLLYDLVGNALGQAADERMMDIQTAWSSDQAERVARKAIDSLKGESRKLRKGESRKLQEAIAIMNEDPEVIFMYLRQPYGIVFSGEDSQG